MKPLPCFLSARQLHTPFHHFIFRRASSRNLNPYAVLASLCSRLQVQFGLCTSCLGLVLPICFYAVRGALRLCRFKLVPMPWELIQPSRPQSDLHSPLPFYSGLQYLGNTRVFAAWTIPRSEHNSVEEAINKPRAWITYLRQFIWDLDIA